MFDDKDDSAVITRKSIINGKAKVMLVFHHEDDGLWEFTDGEDFAEEEAAVVALSEMVQLDSTLQELSDLPVGCGAFRDDEGSHWKWFVIEDE